MPGGPSVLARSLSFRGSSNVAVDPGRGASRSRSRVSSSRRHRAPSSHRSDSARHYNDGPRPEDVTDDRTRLAGGTVRDPPRPPAGGGLPDARLAERGG